MNNVSLVGRLYKSVEVKQSQGGKAIARTGIAVKRDYKNSEGKYDSDFLNVVAFGTTGDFLQKYFDKGSMVAITGKIQTGSYKNKEGATVYTIDIIADKVEFCESKGNSSKQAQQPTPKADDDFMNIPQGIDEELPFA